MARKPKTTAAQRRYSWTSLLKASGKRMAKKRKKKNIGLPGFLVATKKNGKRVRANTSVKMTLRDLRRLVSGARKGRTVKVKARVR